MQTELSLPSMQQLTECAVAGASFETDSGTECLVASGGGEPFDFDLVCPKGSEQWLFTARTIPLFV